MAEQPALTVRRRFPRPTAAQIAAFREVPAGVICDARNRRGALHHRIRHMAGPDRVVGAALTAACGPRDNLTAWAAIDLAEPGDVLILYTGGFEDASVAGDVMVGMARNKGIVAVVTDGAIRDLPGIAAVGIPVFAAGVTPNSPWKNGPGEIGLPVPIGGETVHAGDLVVCDREAVIVIPHAEVDAVVAALPAVLAREAKMDAAVRSGATRHDWLPDALKAKGVRYVD